jgi:predicted MPP superfamily phosphohydrolase
MTRRSLLRGVVGVGTTAVAYPCFYEPRWLEVTERRVRLARAPLRSPVRVLHLSDLHASFIVPLSHIQNAITLGLSAAPDLICLTGDFITFRHDFNTPAYVSALRRLTAVAPTFAVLGNHDGGSWARTRRGNWDHVFVERLLEESGVRLLHNRSERVSVRDDRLTLVGVGDLWSQEIDGSKAFSGAPGKEAVVLLAHNPDSKDRLRAHAWDLMLSGHTHGGQVIVPIEGVRYAPVVDKRYVAGLKPWGTRQIHVTRGVGNVGGVRFRCRPEVSLLVVG